MRSLIIPSYGLPVTVEMGHTALQGLHMLFSVVDAFFLPVLNIFLVVVLTLHPISSCMDTAHQNTNHGTFQHPSIIGSNAFPSKPLSLFCSCVKLCAVRSQYTWFCKTVIRHTVIQRVSPCPDKLKSWPKYTAPSCRKVLSAFAVKWDLHNN